MSPEVIAQQQYMIALSIGGMALIFGLWFLGLMIAHGDWKPNYRVIFTRASQIVIVAMSVAVISVGQQPGWSQQRNTERLDQLEKEVNQHISKSGHQETNERITNMDARLVMLEGVVNQIKGGGAVLGIILVILHIYQIVSFKRNGHDHGKGKVIGGAK